MTDARERDAGDERDLKPEAGGLRKKESLSSDSQSRDSDLKSQASHPGPSFSSLTPHSSRLSDREHLAWTAKLHPLIQACLCDEITDADRDRLENLVQSDPAARRAYVRYLQDSAHLCYWATAQVHVSEGAVSGQRSAVSDQPDLSVVRGPWSVVSGQWSVAREAASVSSQRTADNGLRTKEQSEIRNSSPCPSPLSPSPISHSALRIPHSSSFLRRPMTFSLVVSTVATVIILLIAAQVRFGNDQARSSDPIRSLSSPSFVAQLTGEHECVWSDELESPILGAHLREGRLLDLRAGVAHVTFDRGAVAVVEGPARFVVEGANWGRLERGRLVARIEKKSAIGFAVATPSATVVDLGTEFGVEVDADGATDVQVYTGKVALREAGFQPAGATSLPETFATLRAGEAMRVSARETSAIPDTTSVDYDEQRFVRTVSGSGESPSLVVGDGLRLEGLSLWLRADAIDADDPAQVRKSSDNRYVTRWTDHARRNSNLADAVQMESGRQPKLVAKAIHGLPAVRFDRGRMDYVMNDRTNILNAQAQWTLFVVGRAMPRLDRAVGGSFLTVPGIRFSDKKEFVCAFSHYFSSNLPSPYADAYLVFSDGVNKWNNAVVEDASAVVAEPFLSVYRSSGHGEQIDVQLNGRRLAIDDHAGKVFQPANHKGFILGGRGIDIVDETQAWDGDIAEVLIFDGTLSEEVARKVGDYLADKYGIDFLQPQER